MKKTLWMIMGLLVVASMILVACGAPAPAEEPAQEGFAHLFLRTDLELPQTPSQKPGILYC